MAKLDMPMKAILPYMRIQAKIDKAIDAIALVEVDSIG